MPRKSKVTRDPDHRHPQCRPNPSSDWIYLGHTDNISFMEMWHIGLDDPTEANIVRGLQMIIRCTNHSFMAMYTREIAIQKSRRSKTDRMTYEAAAEFALRVVKEFLIAQADQKFHFHRNEWVQAILGMLGWGNIGPATYVDSLVLEPNVLPLSCMPEIGAENELKHRIRGWVKEDLEAYRNILRKIQAGIIRREAPLTPIGEIIVKAMAYEILAAQNLAQIVDYACK